MFRRLLTAILLVVALPVCAQYNIKKVMEEGRRTLDMGYYLVSMDLFNKVVALKPGNYEAWFLLGKSKFHLEDYEGAESDCGRAIALNPYITDIYLTRSEVAGGGCIAAPYQITQGTLPSIVIAGSGDNARTDIKLGDLEIDAETTVKDFAMAVVSNNADYDFGDQISFFDVLQRVNAVTGIPYCQFLATNVMLDKTSEVKLLDIVSKYGFATVDGYLGHIEGEGDGVYAWVHSRKSSAKTLVSTQSFVNNNAEMIAEYSGDQAYKRSVKTYGGESSSFLTPGTTTTQATDGSVPPVDDSGSGGSSTDQGSGSGGSSSGGSDSGGDEEGGGYYE